MFEAKCIGDGFHPLHWNILSWFLFGLWARVLRVFRLGWVVWGVDGGSYFECIAGGDCKVAGQVVRRCDGRFVLAGFLVGV